VVDALSGCFISFEGVEGGGKSTQSRLLADRVAGLGYDVISTREPGGTELGEVARALTRKPAIFRRFHRVLTGVDWKATDPLAELFLMSAARAQLVGQVILPALARGVVVICDRFDDSTLAYQGYGRGLELATLSAVNAVATRGLRPALTVLIDVPVEIGLRRKRAEVGRDAIGGEALPFHERVRSGYIALAAAEPTRWLVVDGTQPPGLVAERIWERVQPLLPPIPPNTERAG
jgi:dTMP kinase